MSRSSSHQTPRGALAPVETLSQYVQRFEAEAAVLGKGMKTALFIQQFRAGLLHKINPRALDIH
ncbi:hypothetical protein N5D61_17855 [Pseudomonas sp. GD03842]|uniref:hypothetical protein n=1 Tax=unclassified Pseudomonas TaxID=196821 RepID=UPI000D3B7AA8|nr:MULTISPECIES: hypothetical protein [unclassified Pseudomonas]MDH0748188.1 hypothetical protein [Pseudomonas sp. GD03842]RAU47462.1 hypothetical protein DBP26_007310 [Pseudomonas sp. RIT 409]RAU51863.1 hypothetical protein DBY65_018785 [Pseudomonas sp. RIT 412]